MSDEHWHDAQHDEKAWWADCVNTYWEETKQLEYAKLMGIHFTPDERGPYSIDLHGLSVLDIGGGPASLLLKAINPGKLVVADPCEYPNWVEQRYKAHGVGYIRAMGEDLGKTVFKDKFDEVWMYNVLQHTDNPGKIIKNALNALTKTGRLRFFDWVNTPTNTAHPISLTGKKLESWLGQSGQVVSMASSGCYGDAFYGVFNKN